MKKYYPFIYTKEGILGVDSVEDWKSKVLICIISKVGNENRRIYRLFDSHLDFIIFSETFPQNVRHFFEIIHGDRQQKIYFDVEIPQKEGISNLSKYSKSVIEHLLSAILDFSNFCGCPLTLDDIYLYESNSDIKKSYHVIVDRIVPNHQQNRLFYSNVLERIPEEFQCYIDKSVYSSLQQFRCLTSQKPDSNRPKLLLSNWIFGRFHGKFNDEGFKDWLLHVHYYYRSLVTYTSESKEFVFSADILKSLDQSVKKKQVEKSTIHDTQILEAVQLFESSEHSSVYQYSSRSEGIVHLKRLKPAYCPICERNHDNDNAFLTLSRDYTVQFRCFRHPKAFIDIGKVSLTIALPEIETMVEKMISLQHLMEDFEIPKDRYAESIPFLESCIDQVQGQGVCDDFSWKSVV